MKKKAIIIIGAVAMAYSAGIIETHAQSIKIGEAELIYTEDEIPIRYDGSLSTLKKDAGSMYFFHSFGCRLNESNRRSRHSWFYGPPMDPLKVHVLSKQDKDFWDYNGYYKDRKQKGIWILGMYKRDNGDLLGITHSEVRNDYPGKLEDQYFSIGLGYSTDNGESWTYCGEIIRAADPHKNVGGGAYIIKDGYLYVYYNDVDLTDKVTRPSVARSELSRVLDDASNHKVGKWVKYKDGKWNTPGLSEISGTGVIPMVDGKPVDLHADASYCTALGKYLLTAQQAGNLLLFSSSDGVNWIREAVVDVAEEGEIQPYSTFVDFDGPSDDCSKVDGNFYIYFPRKQRSDHEFDYMYRRQISID